MKKVIRYLLIYTSLFVFYSANAQSIKEAELEPSLFNNRYYLMLQLEEIPLIEQQNELKNKGILLLEYLGQNTYSASVKKEILPEISNNKVVKVSAFEPDLKISPYLAFDIQSGKPECEIIVLYHEDILSEEILTECKKHQFEIIYFVPSLYHIVIKTSTEMINQLSRLSWVKYIAPLPPHPATDNLVEKANHRASIISATHSGGKSLTGKGVKIGEWDSGPLGIHVDLSGNTVIKENKVATSSHATHVAGTVLGTGVIDPQAEGMAPGAQIFSWDFYDWIPYEMDTSYKYDSIVMTTNSWAYNTNPTTYHDSCKHRGNYDIYSYLFDRLVRLHPNFVHCFAAGNYQSQCNLSGFRTVSSGPQSAKNTIVIGALQYNNTMTSFSSWGPLRDGRIKPEICGIGQNVNSTTPSNSYGLGSGTSMSTPGVSGTIALLYEQYRNIYKKDPNASTIKAVVCNTADDLGNTGPDFKYGFGKINALRAADVIKNGQFYYDSLSHNTSKTYTVNVPSGIKQLKVMLNWMDVPASMNKPYDSISLINNLNLKVTDTLGNTFYPLILDSSNYNKVAYQGIDSINNIEQIVIDNPYKGKFNIQIHGKRIPSGYQTFAVTYDVVSPAITVVYPSGKESLIPGTSEVIYWDAYGISSNFKIEYSINKGNTWSTISSSVSSGQRYYNWTVPNVISSRCLIRISSGSYSDASDTTFSIMKKPSDLFAKSCNNQVHLFWKPLPEAVAYDVFMESSGRMTKLTNTKDTFYTITGLNNSKSYYFSINAYDSSGAVSLRRFALQFTPDQNILPPVITFQSISDTVCQGNNKTLLFTASGNKPLLKQWQWSKDNGNSWNNISGANDTFIVLNNINKADNGNMYRAQLTNTCMGLVYTNPVTIKVDSGFSIHASPQGFTDCIGNDGFLYAKALNFHSFNQVWQKSNNGLNWNDLSSQVNDTLFFAALSLSDIGFYRLKFQNKCYNDTFTANAKINVNNPLKVKVYSQFDTVCYGQTIKLNAVATGGDSNAYVYQWNLKNIKTSGFTDTLYQTTQYKVIVFDSCSLSPVEDSITIHVLKPLSVEIASSADTICLGKSVVLQATVSGGTNPIYYFWNNTKTTSSITETPSVTTTYYLKITDSCSKNISEDSFSVVVRPALKIKIEIENDSLCFGNLAKLNSINSGGLSSQYKVNWSNGFTGNKMQFIPDSTIWLTATLTDNCTKIPAVDSQFIFMRKAIRTKVFAVSDTICNGNEAQLFTSSEGGLPDNYKFNCNGTLSTDSFFMEKLYQNKTYKLILSDGCSKPDATDSIVITVLPELSVSLKVSDDSICSGNSVNISAEAKGGIPQNYTFSWSNYTDTAYSIQKKIGKNTIFKVTLDDQCSANKASDSIEVFVYQLEPSFNWQETSYRNVSFDPVDKTAYQYKWQFGDNDSSTQVAPQHLYKNNGYYNVCLTVSNFAGCDSVYCKNIYVENPFIKETEINSGWIVYPNPNNGSFTIEYLKPSFSKFNWQVYNVLGEILLEGENTADVQSTISGLDKGIYWLRIYFADEFITFKIISH